MGSSTPIWKHLPSSQRLFPSAGRPGGKEQGFVVGRNEYSPFSKRQGMFADPVTLSLSWHHRPRAEQRTKTSPMAPARVLLELNFWLWEGWKNIVKK